MSALWDAVVAVWPILAVLYFFTLVAIVVDVVCADDVKDDGTRW